MDVNGILAAKVVVWMGFQLDEVLNVEIKLGSPKFSVDEESMGDFEELIYPTHTSHSYIVHVYVQLISMNWETLL